jgi:hypothetical protein
LDVRKGFEIVLRSFIDYEKFQGDLKSTLYEITNFRACRRVEVLL